MTFKNLLLRLYKLKFRLSVLWKLRIKYTHNTVVLDMFEVSNI
jgi:hypothetical protein